MKKVFIVLCTFFLICGCSKKNKPYDENGKNSLKVESDFNIVVTGTQIVTSENQKTLKSKIKHNENIDCDIMEISLFDKEGNIISNISISTGGKILKGQIFTLDEEYNFKGENPYSMTIKYIKNE